MTPAPPVSPRPIPARRRGACPALSAPMRTGDGLLVRLVPESGALQPLVVAGLAHAARRFGNGILEVTARGSLQLRGLSEATVAPLNDAVRALDIAAREGLAIALSPLSGLDAAERMDGRGLADAIRDGVAKAGIGERLGPKVSVVIDGGGTICLDELKADIRLAARTNGAWDIALAGDAGSAVADGATAPQEAAARVLLHLARIARHGTAARMADLLPPASSSLHARATARSGPTPGRAIPLHDGTMAVPLALPFGAADSEDMAALAEAALAHGVRDLRPAPPRLLLATGLAPASLAPFLRSVDTLGFILEPADPRLSVAACPGAPLCASGLIPARALAPQVTQALAPLLDGSLTVHLSGCAKGCAHPAPAALTLVGAETGGMDSAVALVRHGLAGSAPEHVVPLPHLTALLARIAGSRRPEERGIDILDRLPAAALAEPDNR